MLSLSLIFHAVEPRTLGVPGSGRVLQRLACRQSSNSVRLRLIQRNRTKLALTRAPRNSIFVGLNTRRTSDQEGLTLIAVLTEAGRRSPCRHLSTNRLATCRRSSKGRLPCLNDGILTKHLTVSICDISVRGVARIPENPFSASYSSFTGDRPTGRFRHVIRDVDDIQEHKIVSVHRRIDARLLVGDVCALVCAGSPTGCRGVGSELLPHPAKTAGEIVTASNRFAFGISQRYLLKGSEITYD